MMDRIGRERGWLPLTREAYDAGRGPRGATVVGSPAEVAAKTLKAIELFGIEVAPVVREEVARRRG